MNGSIESAVRELCVSAKAASRSLLSETSGVKNGLILAAADALVGKSAEIEAANTEDIAAARATGYPEPMIDRLRFDKKRIESAAQGMRDVAALPDPCGAGERVTRPNGLIITKVRVPLGVVGMIYEARPNVTADAAAITLKTGNAVVLRGGKEAVRTNRAVVSAIRSAIAGKGYPADLVCFIDDVTRESSAALMRMRGLVDVLIPRGGRGLIKSVVENSLVPAIETGAGNCHIYIDDSADMEKSLAVAVNAKCSRPAVCNAAETLLVHEAVKDAFLPKFWEATRKYNLELRCDAESKAAILSAFPDAGLKDVTEEDYATEFDDYIMAVKTVSSLDEAIGHISRYSTMHSECIMTGSLTNAARFRSEIDAAGVYVNASTRFTDGGEFGLGAEIGISTQKLHVRGPMAAEAMTTVKYFIDGDGQVR